VFVVTIEGYGERGGSVQSTSPLCVRVRVRVQHNRQTPGRGRAAAAELTKMSEQDGLRSTSATRNRGGVQRVEGKLRASVEKGEYYEAHQMYRTLFFR